MKKGLFILVALYTLCGCSKNIVSPGNNVGSKLTKAVTHSGMTPRFATVPLKPDSLTGIKMIREYIPFTNKGTPDSVVKTTLTKAAVNGLFPKVSKQPIAADH